MKPPNAAPFSLRRLARVFAVVALVLLISAAYWAHLLNDQATQLRHSEEQARLRAVQMSAAMATQTSTLVAGLEYLVHSLASIYAADPKNYFPLAVQTALQTFPEGSVLQVAVADADGYLTYSSLAGGRQTVSIADRAHFRVHTQGGAAGMYISRPVLGRVSGRWSVQFSYPIVDRKGRFAGVVVLSIAPQYLSGSFRELFGGGSDVALLVHSDGHYLAGSHLQDSALSQPAPRRREFISEPQAQQGE